jgi:signal transduction histidine kinase
MSMGEATVPGPRSGAPASGALPPLSVLIVDDSESDARLLARHVGKHFTLHWERVDTGEALREALGKPFEVVLCDYAMGDFDAPQALAIYRAAASDLPFIVLSGAVGEERAADCMREGAHDFVLKDRLERLVPAIQRERVEAETRASLRASRTALAHSEKLRALGEMAAGISHDLKNVLNPLLLHLELFDRSLGRGNVEAAREATGEMRGVLMRGLEMVERLRTFGHRDSAGHVPIDLRRIAEEAVKLVAPRARAGTVSLETAFAPTPTIAGSGGDLLALVVNLVTNALDAVAARSGNERSRIRVTTATDIDRDRIELTVEDDGPGIPEPERERVFEPFYTTKGVVGTGLGLSMARASAEIHGGSLTVDASPLGGARFVLRLPIAPAR